MFTQLFGKFLENNDYKLSQLKPLVSKINSYEEGFRKLKDEDIKKKTDAWKKQLRTSPYDGEKSKKLLVELLPEAYALVRESARRAMNQSHRDVQLMAGIILHQGKVAEQKTGEGKTLTATLPLYLNGLTGRGAHLVTPNDYLSKHGAGWYGPVYELLGVSVGVIVHDESFIYDPSYTNEDTLDEYSRHLKSVSRQHAYGCDITYGTMSEFGFDYLRDNMRVRKEEFVNINGSGEFGTQAFAIVDEIDNILIDIARTPLIISTSQNVPPSKYQKFAELADGLVTGTDYELDEKDKMVTLTDLGIRKVERKLGVDNLYEKDFETVHHVENALRAKALFLKDRDYVIKNGEIIIVDQNTGRLLFGNRWSNGLHQAVEAKEGVAIQPESTTLATISYQNYYRKYEKLAGMTGTAMTEAEELYKMYGLDVVSVPTFKSVSRKDQNDVVYKTQSGKFRAIANDIAERHAKGQPVLVGTTSVQKSELLSGLLKHMKVPHEILNAKNHEREALIISQAGHKGAVTVSTNMAGRGVDIILGGDPFDAKKYQEIVDMGGLYVLGTERHDSRRIDNQLRGRSGRQGDPGESRFYMSLQDDLLRIFGGDKVEAVMGRLRMDENMPIEAGLIGRTIESAQKKVEGINFDIRKGVVEYDDVMNVQREAIYGLRRKILFSEENAPELFDWVKEKLANNFSESVEKAWNEKLKKFGDAVWFEVIKRITLEVIDVLWTEHIDALDDLRGGVRLRAYGQIDPIVEYKREGKRMFEKLITEIWFTVADRIEKIEIEIDRPQQVDSALGEMRSVLDETPVDYQQGQFESGVGAESSLLSPETPKSITPAKNARELGRNDPCWCGSGKKYKKCHYPN